MKKLIVLMVALVFGYGQIADIEELELFARAKSALDSGDQKSGVTILSALCDDASSTELRAKSCHNLGYLYLSSKEPKMAESLRLFVRACELGFLQSCYSAGLMYDGGLGVAADEFEAVGYFRKSCVADERAGCGELARMYRDGRGVRQDLKKAFELFSKECGVSCAKCCAEAAKMCAPKDSLGYLKKACEAGLGSSCLEVGLSYTNKTHGKEDLKLAKEYFGKACDLRETKGCQSYKVLNEGGY